MSSTSQTQARLEIVSTWDTRVAQSRMCGKSSSPIYCLSTKLLESVSREFYWRHVRSQHVSYPKHERPVRRHSIEGCGLESDRRHTMSPSQSSSPLIGQEVREVTTCMRSQSQCTHREYSSFLLKNPSKPRASKSTLYQHPVSSTFAHYPRRLSTACPHASCDLVVRMIELFKIIFFSCLCQSL